MINQTETKVESPFNVSQQAADVVSNIMAEKNLEGYALRVFVSGSGCCGAKFGMALDNNFRENDLILNLSGIKVVVDDMSLSYLRGASVDYINDPARGEGFVIDNPLQAGGGSCACGSGEKAEGAGCGCGSGGGSCGCGGH
jgi:iron-sulfur cluster assembly protein